MKLLFLTLFFSLTIEYLLSQSDSLTHIQSTRNNKPVSDDKFYQNRSKWVYFNLENTTNCKVIDYSPAPYACGKTTSASISIVMLSTNDTIRIISLCNTDNINNGEKVNFTPTPQPLITPFMPVNKHDTTVIKTTYCLIKNENK